MTRGIRESLLGSCQRDRVCGLLWPFCFCVYSGKKAKAIGRAKSLVPHSLGTRDSSPGPSGQVHFPLWDTQQSKHTQLEQGGREEKRSTVGKALASRAVFLLRTRHQPQTRTERGLLRHRALQSPKASTSHTAPFCQEGSQTLELCLWRVDERDGKAQTLQKQQSPLRLQPAETPTLRSKQTNPGN